MKTKAFNLEEALNGAKIIVRAGHPAEIIYNYENTTLYTIAVLIHKPIGDTISSYNKDGYFISKDQENPYDLLLVDEEPIIEEEENSHVGYRPLYKNVNALLNAPVYLSDEIYKSKEEAYAYYKEHVNDEIQIVGFKKFTW